jgi:trehalose synthase
MGALINIPVPALDPERFETVLDEGAMASWRGLTRRGATELEGRVIWNVNSTARGGGVVELLQPLLGYARGAGVDARWLVISGDAEFFTLTKRLHNRLHGIDGDGGDLGPSERELYERTLARNAAELVALVHPSDVVILHDPQTAGLVDAIASTGAEVIWRCHVGLDVANDTARQAWSFLAPYVLGAARYVFSRAAFAWEDLDPDRISVIRPSIDALSPKNAEQTGTESLAILTRTGIVGGRASGSATFTRADGTRGRVDRRATLDQEEPLRADQQTVVQVSRWDKLKDPIGVLKGFVDHIAPATDAHLLLAGPATEAVSDDPEGAEVLAGVRAQWAGLPDEARRRVHLASLPMVDLDENAAIVNALQRHADVVVQKSLAEGFGLTVAEAMWKKRPVVASRVGGIQDQIVDGISGVLVSDQYDLREYGEAVLGLLGDRDRSAAIGLAAHERVRAEFLGPAHLEHYFALITQLIAEPYGRSASAPDRSGAAGPA